LELIDKFLLRRFAKSSKVKKKCLNIYIVVILKKNKVLIEIKKQIFLLDLMQDFTFFLVSIDIFLFSYSFSIAMQETCKDIGSLFFSSVNFQLREKKLYKKNCA